MSWEPVFDSFRKPDRLYIRSECLSDLSPALRGAGVYAWYFRELPPGVPSDRVHRALNASLLYLGISPSKPGSRSTLRKRLRSHFLGDASRSTLRLALGCLLATELGLHLQPAGRRERLTFGTDGEVRLSEWMERNALVAWLPVNAPWMIEAELIQAFGVPLNLQHNAAHPFHPVLTAIRAKTKVGARLRAIPAGSDPAC